MRESLNFLRIAASILRATAVSFLHVTPRPEATGTTRWHHTYERSNCHDNASRLDPSVIADLQDHQY
jgi:hypothetical protein